MSSPGEVAASGQPVLQTYGISDDDAFAVGLTCGGIIDIFVQPVSSEHFAELGRVGGGRPRGSAGRRGHGDRGPRQDRRQAGHLAG